MDVIHVVKNFEMTNVAQNRVTIFVMSHFKTKRFDYSVLVPIRLICVRLQTHS